MFPFQLLAFLLSSRAKDKEPEDMDEQIKYDQLFRRGDLLEVPRTLFTHFGIYLGGGRVAHFIPDILPLISRDQQQIKQMVTNVRLILGAMTKRGSVRVDSVDDFAYGSPIHINTLDKVCSRPPLQGDEIAQRATKLIGNGSYSLLWYNCEHFVMYCRYGTSMSFQTFKFCRTIRRMLLNWCVALAMTLLSLYLLISCSDGNLWTIVMTFVLSFIIWFTS